MKNNLSLWGLFLLAISPQVFNGFYNPGLMAYPTAFWTVDILTLAAMPILLYGWGLRRGLFTNRDLGLHFQFPGRRQKVIFVAAMIALPFLVFYGFWFLTWLGNFLHYRFFTKGAENFVFDFSMAVSGEGIKRIVIIAYFSITAGLVEEFYYRALPRLFFKSSPFHLILYLLFSSSIFALIHWEGGQVKLFVTFFLGLILAGAYLMTRNLWPLIFGHLVADVLLFAGVKLAVPWGS